MEELKNKLWTAYDLEVPLIIEDFEVYLLREGVFSEDDYKKILEMRRLLKNMIDNLYESKSGKEFEKLKSDIEVVLNLISSLQPKKILPAEMKRRLDDLKHNLEEAKEIISKNSGKLMRN